MQLFYLHGFASSARSSKATFFRDRLAPLGVTLHCPDFNEPDFATLTITRMLDQLDAAIATAAPPAEPVALIGSSLGAFVAWHAAARHARAASANAASADAAGAAGARRHPVVALVLLAPALEFGANRMRDLGPEGVARWKATNRLDVFHYGYGEMRPLEFTLYEDAARYDSTRVVVDAPTLVFQGRRDELVDPDMVERFVAARPTMTLRLLDDDHQLLASLEHIWKETAAFLHLSA
jgi:pimeloyl-ACP methyl ester carboxylesterase